MRRPLLHGLTSSLVAVSFLTLSSSLAACGGGSPQPAGSTKVTMTDFKFSPGSLSATSGKVTLFLVNGAADAHDMVIENGSNKVVARSALVQAGNAITFTVELGPGSYSFYCDIPGHKEGGMIGSITVS